MSKYVINLGCQYASQEIGNSHHKDDDSDHENETNINKDNTNK